MNRRYSLPILLTAMHSCALPYPAAIPAQAQRLPSSAEEGKQTTIGDVTISNATRYSGNPATGFRILGPKTQITFTQRASRSTFRLHADEVEARKERTYPIGAIDLKGHVRFHVTQAVEGGSRTVEGTAGHADFSRTEQVLKLSGGILATAKDTTARGGTATIRAAVLHVDTASTPYHYRIEGDAAHSDLRYIPAANTGGTPRAGQTESSRGETHVSGFERGSLKVGQSARFEGAGTSVAFANPTDGTSARLRAGTIETGFSSDTGALSRISAHGAARYMAERVPDRTHAANGQLAVHHIEGRASNVLYNVTDGLVELTGSVHADITLPDYLRQPAALDAGRILARIEPPYRYEVTANAGRGHLQFAPLASKGRERPDGAPDRRMDRRMDRIDVQDLDITGFDRLVLEPGKQIDISGKQTTLVSTELRGTTRLQAPHIQATYSDQNTLGKAVAFGPVSFYLKRRTPSHGNSVANPAVWQELDGSAAHAEYVDSAEIRQLTLAGPLKATITDPEHLDAPGKVTAADGDSLRLNLSGPNVDIDLDSRSQSASIELQPKQAPPEERTGRQKPRQ